MKAIESEGKNVEEALEKALNQLKVNRNNVSVEVLSEGSKGFFNVIGVKPARVRVSVKYNYIEEAKEFIVTMLKHMNIEVKVDIKEDEDTIMINLSGDKMGIIIGYRGETLDSIQYLVSLIVNKHHDLPHKKVILDTENYRQKRQETLNAVALKTANKVIQSGKSFKLEPMNPYERRIIHASLQGNPSVNTYSEGQEPFRRVVVELKK